MFFPRQEVLKRLHAQVEAGVSILGGGAGTGLSAKCEEAGGIDLIVVYNTGLFRMAGRVSTAGSFAYGDANQIVLDMSREVLPVVQRTPVLAGVCATDPFRLMPVFLKQIKELGFCGVQNVPTVALFDGKMRENMEATGLGYDKEVEMIRLAREMDLLTAPFVFTEAETEAMTRAGADLIVTHVGLTIGGTIGAAVAPKMDQAIEATMRMAEAARRIRPDVLLICHGGPFDEPEAVAEAMKRMPGIHGFFGASSVERLPVERAIKDQVERFKRIPITRA